MNTNISPEVKSMIDAMLVSGRYKDADDVLKSAMLMLQKASIQEEGKLQLLREEIAKGKKDVENGNYSEVSLEEIADNIFKEIEQAG